LPGAKGQRGFSAAHVEKETTAATAPHDPETGEIKQPPAAEDETATGGEGDGGATTSGAAAPPGAEKGPGAGLAGSEEKPATDALGDAGSCQLPGPVVPAP